MTLIESMQKAIDFMEDHLLETITIKEIARAAHLSPFHFQRIFTILTGTTVAEYMRRRRLTLVAQELRKSDDKIIDLAYKYGYDTPESFSKAFRKQHGLSPREVRKKSGKMTAYNRLIIQVSLKGAEPMQYEIVEREAFQVVGIKKGMSCANGENHSLIPKMWEEVNTNGTDQTLLKKNNGPVKGMLGICLSDNEQSERMEYWIAAAHNGEPPENMSKLEIPRSRWAIFSVQGAMPHAMQAAWKKIYSEWFPSNGYENAGGPELEVYSAGNPNSEDYRSEIWIPVK
ncbi:AraC family transcriptional regulator [Guptibacillus algicola]|uniref:AraC family transcriptional regulator n=1 Tax=Guptibacillus algicola TaxID=225844 RepID=UPI001CD1BEAE|nr:AraC family transcriptional regulator [Alkalihalobacillus algicola]MCA0986544.1 AraC family transcriptional regulator [Alkalihalobacillus algicola]